MPNVADGGSATITVTDRAVVSVVVNGGIVRYENPVGTRVLEFGSDQAFGPLSAGSIKLTSVQGAFSYDVGTLALGADDARLVAWASSQAFSVISCARNSDGAITSATIQWPDGVTGVYTADTLSTAFPGSTDAWHATYLGSRTRTLTQSAVTRDSDGAVTAQPAITIA